MSFLRVFQSILHALEAAATIAAPIVKAVDPEVGNLMTLATTTAVSMEAIITAPGSGAQKAAIVQSTTQAAVDLTNALLTSQGKPNLTPAVTQAATQTAQVVVDTLNTVANAVQPQTQTSK